MRKLNNKNKLFMLLFSFIIIGIVVLFIYSMRMSGKFDSTTSLYEISTNSVVYNDESVLINTKKGGNILRNWDKSYYYVDYENNSYDLGDRTVIYEKASEQVYIFGENHFISSNGNVTKNNDYTHVENTNNASFYKLNDRVYLVIAKEICTEDKTIYTSKYLIINIDKQGNASFLNDVINIKTINPLKITFNDYVFDIANEKLTVDGNVIDLKLINGSSNEYKPKSDKITADNVDMKDFIDSYNKLVNDFSQYVNNTNLLIGSNNPVVNNNNNVIINGSGNSGGGVVVQNNTNINKRVSLRGTISYPTSIDVTYVVTDPEEKYQAVYLLVTGIKDEEMLTEKIILDKYDTTYRLTGLEPESEYSVSLGYVEVVNNDGNKDLFDYIEDVVNVRTTAADSILKLERVTPGYVLCTFKMSDKYAFQSGKIVLYADNNEIDSVNINYKQALSKNGQSIKLKLDVGTVFQVRLEDAVYNGNPVVADISTKFTYQSLNVAE